jgi:hypothetical protein
MRGDVIGKTQWLRSFAAKDAAQDDMVAKWMIGGGINPPLLGEPKFVTAHASIEGTEIRQ